MFNRERKINREKGLHRTFTVNIYRYRFQLGSVVEHWSKFRRRRNIRDYAGVHILEKTVPMGTKSCC